ncbi:MAG TPA: hypothetical protein VMS64_05345 [Candidatus Methylomirabilis sp.]|nr:hypothetical protein [Candidatus Methylomirabilis sp.]
MSTKAQDWVVYHSQSVKRISWPPLLLIAYGILFARKALGGGLLVFADHPGQLYRMAHALTEGLAPWRLNPGWWAGYAELQFYPPGFSYAGALLHYASLGSLDYTATYRVLLWVAFLLPGVTTYLLLARVLENDWLALPGAFVALTLSAGSRSGVEEGLRWGLVAARMGWGVLPLLALSLCRWTEGRRAPITAAVLLAAIILIHPAHAPAGVALIALAAWHGPGSRRARVGEAALLTLAGGGLAAVWLVPLVSHLDMALPLAWGDPTLAAVARGLAARPLLVLLVATSALAWWLARRSTSATAMTLWLADLPPALALLVVLDALVAQPLGLRWLPADRLLDSFLLASILGASLSLAELYRRWPVPRWALGLAAVMACAVLSSWNRPEPSLSLWPRPWPNEWPKYGTVARSLDMPALWEAVAKGPPGRILFVRSSVPLESRADWRRPHTHVTALTPLHAGRDIVNGTFTHPSPVAGVVYTGSPQNRAITVLVEQRDGSTLFGRPLAELSAESFNQIATRLRVSSVVALDEDHARLGFVEDNPAFAGPSRIGPFLVFASRDPRPTPERAGPQRWRLALPPHAEGWVPTGMAYSPLWQCRDEGLLLPIRRDDLGLLDVKVPAGGPTVIDLSHVPGLAEWDGLALTVVSGLALAGVWLRRVAGGRRQTSGS